MKRRKPKRWERPPINQDTAAWLDRFFHVWVQSREGFEVATDSEYNSAFSIRFNKHDSFNQPGPYRYGALMRKFTQAGINASSSMSGLTISVPGYERLFSRVGLGTMPGVSGHSLFLEWAFHDTRLDIQYNIDAVEKTVVFAYTNRADMRQLAWHIGLPFTRFESFLGLETSYSLWISEVEAAMDSANLPPPPVAIKFDMPVLESQLLPG